MYSVFANDRFPCLYAQGNLSLRETETLAADVSGKRRPDSEVVAGRRSFPFLS